jgi:RNA polymerase sigma-70 factor (ECF subfamily)
VSAVRGIIRLIASGMIHESSDDVTRILGEWTAGDPDALRRVVPLLYSELKRVARGVLRREPPGRMLQTTGLVHEAYIRLAKLNRLADVDRAHFLSLAGRLMRQILVDEARRASTTKRGSGAVAIGLDATDPAAPAEAVDLLALDEALNRLAALDPRQCRIVELRFFAGLTAEEAAAALGISVPTLQREWAMARAWLNAELR